MEEKLTRKKTIIGGIVLAVFPILSQYPLPIMSYGFVLLLIYFMLRFLGGNGQLWFNKPMLYFIVYSLVQQFIVYQVSDTFQKNLNTYLFMLICLFMLASVNKIEKEDFLKAYIIVGFICCIVVIYQFVMGNVLGVPQSAIQILPVSAENQHYWMENKTRASGFFTEPQAFSSYILPLLVYMIYNRKFKTAIFISISIFASTSSQGIILAFIVWMVYLYTHDRDIAKKVLLTLFVIVGLIFILVILRNNGIFSFAIDKILSINAFTYDIRLTKGFDIYSAMPIMDKIFGIGFGNLTEYLLHGNFDFFWIRLTQEQLVGYITTMANTLVSFGIGGFIFYIGIFKGNMKTSSEPAKLILLLTFISSFTQTILFNAWFVLYWMIFELFDIIDDSRYTTLSLGIGKRS